MLYGIPAFRKRRYEALFIGLQCMPRREESLLAGEAGCASLGFSYRYAFWSCCMARFGVAFVQHWCSIELGLKHGVNTT